MKLVLTIDGPHSLDLDDGVWAEPEGERSFSPDIHNFKGQPRLKNRGAAPHARSWTGIAIARRSIEATLKLQ